MLVLCYHVTRVWIRRSFIVLCFLGLCVFSSTVILSHFSGRHPIVKLTRDLLDNKLAMSGNIKTTQDMVANAPLSSVSDTGLKSVTPLRQVVNINCRDLIAGENSTREKVRTIMLSFQPPFLTNSYFVNVAKNNCHTFRSQRGYVMNPMTSEEEDFPIAYGIMLHKDVHQFERLLRAIYRPQNVYCIHVDKKAENAVREAVQGIASCFHNVFLSSRSVEVVWSEFGVLEADLICMEEVLQYRNWSYYLNLAGQEFPLKTNYDIVKILKALNGSNDIDVDNTGHFRHRWSGAGLPPHRLRRYKGLRYMAVTRSFVQFALYNPIARDLLAWCRNTSLPEETFFTTLNHNWRVSAPGGYLGRKSAHSNNKDKPYLARFVKWGSQSCAGKLVRTVCIFGIGDLPLLVKRRELFAKQILFRF